jgi:hypothetical protein
MIYQFFNGPMQTTSSATKVTTGNSGPKTMLQFKPILPCRILEWGFGFDGFAAATPLQVELIETGTVFGTVTAYAAADLTGVDCEAVNFGDPTSNYISVGTSASGYTCTSEGSITAVRNLSGPQLAPPTGPFIQQYPLGEESYCQAGKCIRIRMNAGTAVNAYCYLKVGF